MNKYIYTTLLLVLFAVQIFVPAQMVYLQEDALDTGRAYKFKTQPIDPSDPFRGKYITLNYEIDSYQSDEKNWPENDKVYVYLKNDKEGYAAIKTVSKTKLDLREDYILTKPYSTYDGHIRIDFAFNRFYMNENKAYDAEVSVRNAQRDSVQVCYGLVYVKQGVAVLDNVFINDQPIQQFVEAYQKLEK